MAMNLGKAKSEPNSREQGLEVQEYDIAADREAVRGRLKNSSEIDELTSLIEVDNLESIVTFGAKTAEEISKASDAVLRGMNLAQLDESSAMLKALSKIMSQFDIDEIRDDPSIFGKIFGNAKKKLDKILAKYHTMGEDVDKIYIQLKKYEAEIKESNQKLELMFQTNVGYYHELVKYIAAGEQGCKEIEEYVAQKQAEYESSGDQALQFEINSLNQALTMLEQRTQDLRMAENVAMQSVPMIRTMEFTNVNLIRKINSAFIVTLPVFKQSLAQAILLKRQKIQAEAMAMLDEKTNEMLLKNAKNTADQAKIAARLASGSSIQIETLEKTWETIMSGIEETRRIQESAHQKRLDDQKRLELIKKDFESKFKS